MVWARHSLKPDVYALLRARASAALPPLSTCPQAAAPLSEPGWSPAARRELTMAKQEGFNQSPPYVDVDLFASDQPLKEVVAANGAEDEALLLAAFGRRWGAADMIEQARLANENPPKLHAYDAKGF